MNAAVQQFAGTTETENQSTVLLAAAGPLTETPELPGIVFVNFHSEALVQPRVDLLRRSGFVVRVADNSSTYPDSDGRIEIGRNVGFGAACNRAVDALPRSVTSVCFHNPDVSIDPSAIADLARNLRTMSAPGACAPALRVGTKIRTNGFHYPGLAREVFVALRGSSRRGHAGRQHETPGVERRVAGRGRRFASGALVVCDRGAFESLGGFDERFFLYGEDLDLWHRLSLSGRSTGFVPSIIADHASATGSPATTGTRELLRWIGVELFVEKHSYGSWQLMRHAHRLLLRRLVDVPMPILNTVTDLWSRAATPMETSASVRQLLVSDDL